MSPEPAPPRKRASSFMHQIALAMELPFVLVAGVVMGGVVGWLLDRWWDTSPAMTLLLGLLGFAGGVREVLRRIPKDENQNEQ